MLIYPEIIPTPDNPTIKFNQPKDQIDLGKELPRILHAQGWGCGTYFNVQFFNHEKTKLLSCGRFVVSEEIETIQTNDANPYQPMTRTVFSRRAEQIGEWWVLPELLKRLFDEGIGNQGAGAPKYKVSWNPGKKHFQVRLGEEIVFETTDKELAHQVADGKVPIPHAA